ncbi:MAG: IS1595 family transposase [Actinobacteria bacterium]|nr:IS1595 family transposase [Actinomycetota bacterium]
MNDPQTLIEFMEMFKTGKIAAKRFLSTAGRMDFAVRAAATAAPMHIRSGRSRAMVRGEGELMLAGVVEMDEAYAGGAGKGIRGRGALGKTPVAVMAQQNESGGCNLAHMLVVKDIGGLSLKGAATSYITPGSVLVTDGLPSYQPLGSGFDHQPLVADGVENPAELLSWVHIIISNLKRWLLDVFHGVSAKHLQSYLDEFCYRFNRRSERTDLLRRVLNRCVRYTKPATYAQLVAF